MNMVHTIVHSMHSNWTSLEYIYIYISDIFWCILIYTDIYFLCTKPPYLLPQPPVESRWNPAGRRRTWAPHLLRAYPSSAPAKSWKPDVDVAGPGRQAADHRHFLMKYIYIYLWILWSIWFVISHDFWCHIVYLIFRFDSNDFKASHIISPTATHLHLHNFMTLRHPWLSEHLVIWSGVTAVSCHGSAPIETCLHGKKTCFPGLKGLSCSHVHWTVCIYIYIYILYHVYIYIYYMIHFL